MTNRYVWLTMAITIVFALRLLVLSIDVLTYNVNKRAKASSTPNGLESLTLVASVTCLLASQWIRK